MGVFGGCSCCSVFFNLFLCMHNGVVGLADVHAPERVKYNAIINIVIKINDVPFIYVCSPPPTSELGVFLNFFLHRILEKVKCYK